MDMKKREGESEDRRKRWEEDNERQRMEIEKLIEEVYPRPPLAITAQWFSCDIEIPFN